MRVAPLLHFPAMAWDSIFEVGNPEQPESIELKSVSQEAA
jgi:hypothetical protein